MLKLITLSLALFGSIKTLAVYVECLNASGGAGPIFLVKDIPKLKKYTAVFSNRSTGKNNKININLQSAISYDVGADLYNRNKEKEIIDLVIPDLFGNDVNYSAQCIFTNNSQNNNPRSHNLQNNDAKNNKVKAREIEEYANQQARTVANRVISTYGEQENYNYQFVRGLQDGYLAKKIFTLSNSIYNNGYRDGQKDGEDTALKVAVQEAKKRASLLAKRDAKTRHIQAAKNHGGVRGEVVIPNETLSTELPYIDVDSKMKEYFKNINSDVIYEFRTLRYGDSFYTIRHQIDDKFDLFSWHKRQGKYEMLDSYFKDYYALQEWKNNGLGGKYNYTLYKNLSGSEKEIFESRFQKVYNEVIGEKLISKVQASNPSAYARGLFWGYNVANKESYFRGYESGYNNALKNAGDPAFKEEFALSYGEDFSRWLYYYDINLALEVDIALKPSLTKAGYFDLIGQVTNISGISAYRPRVTVNGANIDQQGFFDLPTIADHSFKNINIPNIALLNEEIIADKIYEFTVEIGNFKSNFSFSIAFADLIKNYSDNNGVQKKIYRDSILQTILVEWDNNHGTWDTDIYAKSINSDLNSSYLGRLVKAKQQFQDLQNLRNDIEKLNRSGSWIHFNKNSSFMTLLRKL